MRNETLIEISSFQIGLTVIPVLGMTAVSWYFDFGLENSIIVGVVRAWIQLSVLSFILNPIFSWGESCWWVVAAYILFMVILASFVTSNRLTYYFDGMFWSILAALFANVAWVSIFAFAVILQPTPVWDPQYVIPVVGMLLGNCINGTSLALNGILTSFVESTREIELYLSFGASSYEASSRLLKEAVRTSTVPQLNGMAIIGLISIPGMMTGQILGGSTVLDAARYQILITYLIAVCSFGAIFSQLFLVLRICFDKHVILKTDRLKKRQVKPNTLALLQDLCTGKLLSGFFEKPRKTIPAGDIRSSSVSPSPDETTSLVTKGEIKVLVSSQDGDERSNQTSLVVSKLSYSFDNRNVKAFNSEKIQVLEEGKMERLWQRILFSDLSFELNRGGSAIIQGPSGTGKSTLLRLMAGLVSHQSGRIDLGGETVITKNGNNMADWRRRILYVPQTKVDIPGTPLDFIQRISSFRVRTNNNGCDTLIDLEVKANTEQILSTWGLNTALLEAEWKTLSGGESQKVLLAIALGTRPTVILLDESTSAMDPTSKIHIENTVLDHCTEFGLTAIWVTHDENQAERIRQRTMCNNNNNSDNLGTVERVG